MNIKEWERVSGDVFAKTFESGLVFTVICNFFARFGTEAVAGEKTSVFCD